jgi:leucyl aminopeptidase
MLKTHLFSKKFSQLAKIIFTKQTADAKNIIYFATEGEMKAKSNEVTNTINFVQPVIQQDVEKNKFALVYSFPNNSIFSERLIYTEAPKNDLEKTRAMAAKAMRTFNSFKLDTLHVLFSKDFPLANRQIAINSLIQTNYEYKISGKKKINNKEKNSSSNNKDNNENDREFNVVKEIKIFNDEMISQNIQDFKVYASMANAALYTRELANMRPNYSSCDYLEEVSRTIAKGNSKIKIEVIKGNDLLKNNLNLLHAVGKAAESQPRMVILHYQGKPAEKTISHAIVGKGLTFDTGGLNLKPTNYIEDMYLDKHGACNALSSFKYAVDWNLPLNLVCAVGLADNAIDSNSYKPSDIITSHKVIFFIFLFLL